MNIKPTIYLVAGNRLLRDTLARLLVKRGNCDVCGVSPFLPDVVSSINDSGAQVLILDSVTASLSDYALVSEIISLRPEMKVVLIDMEDDPDVFLECVRAGALGYVLEDASAEEVVAAVQAVVQGRAICPPQFCIHLFHAFSRQCATVPSARIRLQFGLTRRQQQLVPLIAQGLTNKEIAGQLNLSEKTIKNHVHDIFRRVGATDRLQVADLTRLWGVLR